MCTVPPIGLHSGDGLSVGREVGEGARVGADVGTGDGERVGGGVALRLTAAPPGAPGGRITRGACCFKPIYRIIR